MEDHLMNGLGMIPTIEDSALYLKRDDSKVIEVCGSYVDDALNAGNPKSEKLTEAALKQFDAKPRVSDCFDFYGMQVESL